MKSSGDAAATLIVYIFMWGLYLWMVTAVTQHVVFWLAGVWVPWFVGILGGLLGPVTMGSWFILWVMHFVPSIHWPLFH